MWPSQQSFPADSQLPSLPNGGFHSAPYACDRVGQSASQQVLPPGAAARCSPPENCANAQVHSGWEPLPHSCRTSLVSAAPSDVSGQQSSTVTGLPPQAPSWTASTPVPNQMPFTTPHARSATISGNAGAYRSEVVSDLRSDAHRKAPQVDKASLCAGTVPYVPASSTPQSGLPRSSVDTTDPLRSHDGLYWGGTHSSGTSTVSSELAEKVAPATTAGVSNTLSQQQHVSGSALARSAAEPRQAVSRHQDVHTQDGNQSIFQTNASSSLSTGPGFSRNGVGEATAEQPTRSEQSIFFPQHPRASPGHVEAPPVESQQSSQSMPSVLYGQRCTRAGHTASASATTTVPSGGVSGSPAVGQSAQITTQPTTARPFEEVSHHVGSLRRGPAGAPSPQSSAVPRSPISTETLPDTPGCLLEGVPTVQQPAASPDSSKSDSSQDGGISLVSHAQAERRQQMETGQARNRGNGADAATRFGAAGDASPQPSGKTCPGSAEYETQQFSRGNQPQQPYHQRPQQDSAGLVCAAEKKSPSPVFTRATGVSEGAPFDEQQFSQSATPMPESVRPQGKGNNSPTTFECHADQHRAQGCPQGLSGQHASFQRDAPPLEGTAVQGGGVSYEYSDRGSNARHTADQGLVQEVAFSSLQRPQEYPAYPQQANQFMNQIASEDLQRQQQHGPMYAQQSAGAECSGLSDLASQQSGFTAARPSYCTRPTQQRPGHSGRPGTDSSSSGRRRPSPKPPSPSASSAEVEGPPASLVSPSYGQAAVAASSVASSSSSVVPPRVTTLTRAVNSRIDPSQVPRPEGRSEAVTQEGGRVYESDKYNLPPNPCSIYTVLDRGSCSCRYMRSTLNHVPAFSHTLSLSSLLFGILVQPFAQRGRCEEDIPVVDLTSSSPLFTSYLGQQHRGGAITSVGGGRSGSSSDKKANTTSEGPVRCPKCRCYINPFMAWASGGNECVCNLCQHHFLLPEYYMEALHLYRSHMHTDGGGRMGGHTNSQRSSDPELKGFERHELWKGSVDFVAPKEYEKNVEKRRRSTEGGIGTETSSSQARHGASSSSSGATNASAEAYARSAAVSCFSGHNVVSSFFQVSREQLETRVLRQFPCVVFVLDISAAALRSNLANSCIYALAELLRNFRGVLKVQIALILYSDRLIFLPRKEESCADGAVVGDSRGTGEKDMVQWEGSADTESTRARKIQAMFVADVDDPFLPAPVDLLFYSPHQYLELEAILGHLPRLLEDLSGACGDRSAGNAAMKVAVDLVAERGAGGMVEMFHGACPNYGLGALKGDPVHKETTGVGGASFEFQQREFYDGVILDCYSAGVCVDVHAYPSSRRDKMMLQTLESIATHTGGKVFYQHDFFWQRDHTRIYEDLSRLLTSPLAFMCEVKLRTSTGIAVDKILAPFGGPRVLYDQSAFRIPRLDADLTIAFLCKHTQQLESVKQVYVQFVCAYTPLQPFDYGEDTGSYLTSPPHRRYLRVHTLSLPITFSLSSLFRFAEVESMLAVMVRMAAKMVLHSEPDWKEKTMDRLVSILHAYRANCASTSSAGQLILPDSLKLLPIYTMALFKHAVGRACAFRSSEVREDERVWHLVRFMGLPVHAYPGLLYPRVFPLHRSYIEKSRETKMLQRAGRPTGVGDNVYLPDSVAATGVKISSDGVFLCDIGTALYLYIGSQVKHEYLVGLFGEDAVVDEQNAPYLRLRTDNDSPGNLVSRIVKQIQKDKASLPYLPLRVVCASSLDETRLLTHLVEDAIAGDGCYVDFLCGLHKMVHNKLDDG
ncbi:sec23 sec24 trunk domain-containing protein [Cystoisospora suis]|uniref:Sec23 sec24 trunk domain-containing protein n=1 Tax=Cystoisospora suis TaxID=483139 RepID=A0A2C6KLI4_9APIC|nr:sec23 sec24 trunk domain-containing protein [Cystoisospora suis]